MPLIEITLLIQLGRAVGTAGTLGIVILTGVFGAVLARREGLGIYRAARLKWMSGQVPARELIEGVLILISAAFLVTPGVLTDAVGFILLLPWIREAAAERIRRRIIHRLGR